MCVLWNILGNPTLAKGAQIWNWGLVSWDSSVTGPNLGLLTHRAAKPIYWELVVEGKCSIYLGVPRNDNKRAACAQKTSTPQRLSGEDF